MVYQVTDIVRDVRVVMDENKTNDSLLSEGDVDTLMLDEIVLDKIEEAVRRVVVDAPVHLLDGGETFGDAISWKSQCSGWTLLPDDFLRLIVFRMSDWERPVYQPITAADPQYVLQSSRYKGLRGNPQKPVVAIVTRQEGRILEFYSCNSEDAQVEQALYMPLPAIDDDGGIEIPERCYRAAVYQAAALVLITIGQGELGAQLTELSKGLLL